MKTIAFLITSPIFAYCASGEYNGYVAIPPEHPLYEKSYDTDEVDRLDVHGGVTFSGYVKDLPSIDEYLDHEEPPHDWWVLGFDTCHFLDTPEYWNLDRCTEETRKLQKQLEE